MFELGLQALHAFGQSFLIAREPARGVSSWLSGPSCLSASCLSGPSGLSCPSLTRLSQRSLGLGKLAGLELQVAECALLALRRAGLQLLFRPAQFFERARAAFRGAGSVLAAHSVSRPSHRLRGCSHAIRSTPCLTGLPCSARLPRLT